MDYNKQPTTQINYTQYKYFAILVMMYVTITLCSMVLTYRMVSRPFLTQAGTFVKPIWFTLSDIIAEIYGLQISKKLIWFCFICQTFFVIACELLIRLPAPDLSVGNKMAYDVVLGSLWWTTISSLMAYLIAGYININIITRWKVMVQGRYFWLRSMGASGVSEAIYTIIAVAMIQIGHPLTYIIKIIAASFLLKIIYIVILSWPANLLVLHIKKVTGLDAYDSIEFNPFVTDQDRENRGSDKIPC